MALILANYSNRVFTDVISSHTSMVLIKFLFYSAAVVFGTIGAYEFFKGIIKFSKKNEIVGLNNRIINIKKEKTNCVESINNIIEELDSYQQRIKIIDDKINNYHKKIQINQDFIAEKFI